MNILEAVASCFSKYATFSGRACRSEYWWFTLFNIVVGFALGFLQGMAGQEIGIADLYSLAVLVPGLAVGARRLHDIGRSGWWQLLIIVPIVGWIVLLVWDCTKGEPSPNRYGANPIGHEAIGQV